MNYIEEINERLKLDKILSFVVNGETLLKDYSDQTLYERIRSNEDLFAEKLEAELGKDRYAEVEDEFTGINTELEKAHINLGAHIGARIVFDLLKDLK